VSEQIFNGTSAQVDYTVPFTSVHAGKYGQKTNQKQTLLKLSTTQKKANNTKHTKNKSTLVQPPFTTLGQKMRWVCSKMLPSHTTMMLYSTIPYDTTEQLTMWSA